MSEPDVDSEGDDGTEACDVPVDLVELNEVLRYERAVETGPNDSEAPE